jgi:hypothetical protein
VIRLLQPAPSAWLLLILLGGWPLSSGAPVLPITPTNPHTIPVPLGYQENAFAPDGSRCPGACGQGCSSACEAEEFQACDSENPALVVHGERFTCGTHPLCSQLEGCLDGCGLSSSDGVGRLGALLGFPRAYAPVFPLGPGEEPQEPTPVFGGATCQTQCRNDAAAAAGDLLGSEEAGLSAVASWSMGHGPYDDASVFEYTVEHPDGPRRTSNCGPCETCSNGECRRDPQACPDPGPPGDTPGAPPVPMISSGDVHVTTLDRVRFDLQSVGEFVLIEDERGDMVVQARTKPVGGLASVNSAAAIRVVEDVVAIYIDPQLRVTLNGADVTLADGETLSLDQGGRVERRNNSYHVYWPDGSMVAVHTYGSILSIGARLAEGRRGRVRGVAGNFDGDPTNDFQARDGQTLPRHPERAELYAVFGDSWRISDEESLFDYEEGASTATYTDLDFPSEHVILDSLAAEAMAAAEAACKDIRHPRLYRDCLYDVALTGDDAYAAIHGADAPPAVEVPAPWLAAVDPGAMTMVAPERVAAGGAVEVSWSGDRLPGDYIAIAREGSAADVYHSHRVVAGASPVTVPAPRASGPFLVRYVQGYAVAAETPIQVDPPPAALTAPDAVPAGSKFAIEWSGPDDPRDYLAIAPLDAPGHQQHSYHYVERGSPGMLTAPDEPGDYEVRYVQHQSRAVLARRPITVTPVTATVDAVDEIPSGGRFEVRWTGPDNPQDYVAIAPGDAPGHQQHSYHYVERGSPGMLTAPDEPGDYEVRYVQRQSRTVLARRPITVTPVTATVDAVDEIPSGGRFEVRWTGPDNPQDYVSIAPRDAPGHQQHSYHYVERGKPGMLTAPDEPGDYEVRYVQRQSRTVLARRPITVTEP